MIVGTHHIPVRFARLSHTAHRPVRSNGDEDAAFDLHAAHQAAIHPGETVLIGTGIAVEIPEGAAGLILPRSSLATKRNLHVANSPGLIDPGYRGEIKVALYHAPNERPWAQMPEQIYTLDRIAQLLIVPTLTPSFLEVPEDELQESERGEGGFGSTGR